MTYLLPILLGLPLVAAIVVAIADRGNGQTARILGLAASVLTFVLSLGLLLLDYSQGDLVAALEALPRPDVAHIMHPRNVLAWRAVRWLKAHGVPVVWTWLGPYHDRWLIADRERPYEHQPHPEWLLYTLGAAVARTLRDGRLRENLRNYGIHEPLKHVDAFVPCSRHEAEVLQEAGVHAPDGLLDQGAPQGVVLGGQGGHRLRHPFQCLLVRAFLGGDRLLGAGPGPAGDGDEVVVEDELVATGSQQVRGGVADAAADDPLVILLQLRHQG